MLAGSIRREAAPLAANDLIGPVFMLRESATAVKGRVDG